VISFDNSSYGNEDWSTVLPSFIRLYLGIVKRKGDSSAGVSINGYPGRLEKRGPKWQSCRNLNFYSVVQSSLLDV
jgi:hypothetical protein